MMRGTWMCVVLMCALVGGLLAAGPAGAVPNYRIENLGLLPGAVSSNAAAINDAGMVVGTSNTASVGLAFVWDPVLGMQQLPLPTPTTPSGAKGVNNLGYVVGYVYDANSNPHPALWAKDANGVWVRTDLDTPGFGAGYANAISSSDPPLIVGTCSTDTASHAVVWEYEGGAWVLTDLHLASSVAGTNSNANDVNASGQIAGSAGHPCLWQRTGDAWTATDLAATVGSAASINDHGQVTGSLAGPYDNYLFMWDSGVLTNLGRLGGWARTWGSGIRSGLPVQIVGGAGDGWPASGHLTKMDNTSMICENGQLSDLNRFVSTSWNVKTTSRINAGGQIVGAMDIGSGQGRAYRLTPVYFPTSVPGGPYTGQFGTAIQFNGSSSGDSDGTIAWYRWDFGDSSVDRIQEGATLKTPTHTYAAAGTYTAALTVTDNSGWSDTRATTVTVTAPQYKRMVHVEAIAMSSEWQYPKGRARAVVTILDAGAVAASGVTVKGHWTGASPSGTVSLVTDRNGQATFVSSWVKNGGTWTFWVDGVTSTDPNIQYDPSANKVGSGTVTYAPFG
jgi:hypothetical protein